MSRIFGMIIGGALGAFTGFLYRVGVWSVHGTGRSLTGNSADVIVAGALLGILCGMLVSRLIEIYISRAKALKAVSSLDKSNIQLREEKLDIIKKRIKKAEVTVHKEIFREVKHIEVPVTREEIVIEKTVPDNGASNGSSVCIETIRIPIAEERIEVVRHPEIKEEVTVYNHEIQETEHIEEILKKEELQVKTTGDPDIINKDIKE